MATWNEGEFVLKEKSDDITFVGTGGVQWVLQLWCVWHKSFRVFVRAYWLSFVHLPC